MIGPLAKRANEPSLLWICAEKVVAISAATSLEDAWKRSWHDTDELGEALKELTESEDQPVPTIIALSPDLILNCQFAPPPQSTAESLTYLAEEELPLAAEEMTRVFMSDASNTSCVAAENSVVDTIRSSFSPRQIKILPATFLSVSTATEKSETTSTDTRFRVFRPDRIEILDWRKGVKGWQSYPRSLYAMLASSGQPQAVPDTLDLHFDSEVDTDHAEYRMLQNTLQHTGRFRFNQLDLLAGANSVSVSDNVDSRLQRLCQMITLCAVVVIAVFILRQNEVQKRLAEVEQAQKEIAGNIIPNVQAQGANRKLRAEVQRRQALQKEWSEWQQQQPDIPTRVAQLLTTLQGQESLSLESIEVVGSTATVHVDSARPIRDLLHGLLEGEQWQFKAFESRTENGIHQTSVTIEKVVHRE